MATSAQRRQEITAGVWDGVLQKLYGPSKEMLARQRARWCAALDGFERYFGPGRQVRIYTAPGRAELAATTPTTSTATAWRRRWGWTWWQWPPKTTTATYGSSPGGSQAGRDRPGPVRPAEWGVHPLGQPDPWPRRGLPLDGPGGGRYDAYTTSDVLRGSGLSSSAAFEMGMGAIMNGEFGCGLTAAQVALWASTPKTSTRQAQRPAGPAGQRAGRGDLCRLRGPRDPARGKDPCPGAAAEGMSLCVTDTRGSHSELTAEFAAIRSEMEAVAACFDGCKVLGQVREQDFWARLPALRAQCGDRACLRAAHFFRENARTLAEDRALRAGRFGEFLALVRESGHDSFALCQNVYSGADPRTRAFRWRWPSASTFWRTAAAPGGCREAALPAPSSIRPL